MTTLLIEKRRIKKGGLKATLFALYIYLGHPLFNLLLSRFEKLNRKASPAT